MGFDEGHIIFDNRNRVFNPGELISGTLVFNQEKVKTFRGLFIKLKGFCDVHWTTTHTKTVNGKSSSYTKHHRAHENYIEEKVFLKGGTEGEVHLNPGHYKFPFQFRLPSNIPSSFEGTYGHIRYEVKAQVDRAFKFDQDMKYKITVINKKDLNNDPYCRQHLVFEFEDTFCCWCMSVGRYDALVKLPRSGFCPGQTIYFEAKFNNRSTVKINYVKFKLVERRKFTATSNPGTRKEKSVIAKLRKGPIPGKTTRNWQLEFDIPEMDLYNVDNCKYINISHTFEITISPSGCHSNADESRRIVLGHLPIRDFQFNDTSKGDATADTVTDKLTGLTIHSKEKSSQSMSNINPNHLNPNQNQQNPGLNKSLPNSTSLCNLPYPDVRSSSFSGGMPLPFSGGMPLPSVSPYPDNRYSNVSKQEQHDITKNEEKQNPSSVPLLPPPLPEAAMPYPLHFSAVNPYAIASAPQLITPDQHDQVSFNPEDKNQKKLNS